MAWAEAERVDFVAVFPRMRPASPAVDAALSDPSNETPKLDDPAFSTARYSIIATPERALQQACALAPRWVPRIALARARPTDRSAR